ncbi:MAG: DNA replication/repair protein RecF [Clostridia bacterium]|nr:DNA replication/repair protein RecF [Clostridia bacterium]
MYIDKVELENFRNYSSQKIDFINGINLFVGNNAQGKTNIIESIYVSAFGKSYRTIKDNELINFDSDFCRVKLLYSKNGLNNNNEVYIEESKKVIKNNGLKVNKISDFVGEILIVIFSPDSLDIVKGSPGKRRNFIDMICCQLSKSYLISHQEYMKCLKLKNSMLKKDIIDKEYILILHEKMSVYIKKIVEFRKYVIDRLLEKAKVIENKITNGKESIDIIYTTDFLNMNEEEIINYLNKYLFIDEMRKSSIKGIQRDDIIININDLEVSKFGSQGQNRTALLTLKLADFEVLMEEKQEVPILLLDDIMSELDKDRISFLLKYIENYQSIITTTDDTFVKDIRNIKISKVSNGGLEI